MIETWRELSQLEGRYSVSDQGRIRNNRTGIVLKPYCSNRGYHVVTIKFKGPRKTYTLHRLILSAFLPNEDHDILQINHKNWNKLDNRLVNLEWVTSRENILRRQLDSFPKSIKAIKELFAVYTDDELSHILVKMGTEYAQKPEGREVKVCSP